MSVHYKFKSAVDFDTVTFDGLHISVADLKSAISQQKRIGKTSDFDLEVTNAQTKEVYADDDFLIPKNASLLIARIPLAQKPKKPRDYLNNVTEQRKDVSQAKVSADIHLMEGSEQDKITAMISQSTVDYDPNQYQKLKGQTGELPANYRCFKCMKPGHWIKDCTYTGIAIRSKNTEIKRSTGIPQSFMIPVADPKVQGAMMTPAGNYAVPAIDREAYKASEDSTGPAQPDAEPVVAREVPKELLCNLCKDALVDAVMIPCCGNSFCDECIRNTLLESEEHECPDCREKEILPTTLIPNRYLRNAVATFRNQTGYSRQLPQRPRPLIVEKQVDVNKHDSGHLNNIEDQKKDAWCEPGAPADGRELQEADEHIHNSNHDSGSPHRHLSRRDYSSRRHYDSHYRNPPHLGPPPVHMMHSHSGPPIAGSSGVIPGQGPGMDGHHLRMPPIAGPPFHRGIPPPGPIGPYAPGPGFGPSNLIGPFGPPPVGIRPRFPPHFEGSAIRTNVPDVPKYSSRPPGRSERPEDDPLEAFNKMIKEKEERARRRQRYSRSRSRSRSRSFERVNRAERVVYSRSRSRSRSWSQRRRTPPPVPASRRRRERTPSLSRSPSPRRHRSPRFRSPMRRASPPRYVDNNDGRASPREQPPYVPPPRYGPRDNGLGSSAFLSLSPLPSLHAAPGSDSSPNYRDRFEDSIYDDIPPPGTETPIPGYEAPPFEILEGVPRSDSVHDRKPLHGSPYPRPSYLDPPESYREIIPSLDSNFRNSYRDGQPLFRDDHIAYRESPHTNMYRGGQPYRGPTDSRDPENRIEFRDTHRNAHRAGSRGRHHENGLRENTREERDNRPRDSRRVDYDRDKRREPRERREHRDRDHRNKEQREREPRDREPREREHRSSRHDKYEERSKREKSRDSRERAPSAERRRRTSRSPKRLRSKERKSKRSSISREKEKSVDLKERDKLRDKTPEDKYRDSKERKARDKKKKKKEVEKEKEKEKKKKKERKEKKDKDDISDHQERMVTESEDVNDTYDQDSGPKMAISHQKLIVAQGPKMELYDDQEEVDKHIVESYGKQMESTQNQNINDEKEFDGLELQAAAEELELKGEIDQPIIDQNDEMLANVPELSKWEVDDEIASRKTEREPGELSPESDHVKVTTEVIKRAENAIFAKTGHSKKPNEAKSYSETKRKVRVKNGVDSSSIKSEDILGTSPPPKQSIKERLGNKISDHKPRDELLRSRSRTPRNDQARKITVKVKSENRLELEKEKRRTEKLKKIKEKEDAMKKLALDEANFEPDYDENVEDINEPKETKTVVEPKKPKREPKKRVAVSESSSSDSDSDTSSDSSGVKKKKRKIKKKAKKKKVRRHDSDSDSNSDDSSSDEPKKKKKKNKHKKKVSKKKKKSKK